MHIQKSGHTEIPPLPLKSEKIADCDEIRPEMLKDWNREVLRLARVCQLAWRARRGPKDYRG